MRSGEKIVKTRKEKGISQIELAKKCNMLYQTLSKYERGILNPKIDTIKKIAKALNVPYTDLLDDFPMEEVERSFLSYADEIARKRNIYDIDHRLQKIGYYLSLTLDENVHISTLNIDGKKIKVTDEELIALEKDSDDYLKFKLVELANKKKNKD